MWARTRHSDRWGRGGSGWEAGGVAAKEWGWASSHSGGWVEWSEAGKAGILDGNEKVVVNVEGKKRGEGEEAKGKPASATCGTRTTTTGWW